jgi:hypothetical protein
METRFDRVEEIASEALERVGRQWVAHVAPAPGRGAAAGDPFVVWNPNATGAALVDAELELDVPGSRTAHVRDASGRRIPADLQIVGEGSSWGGSFPKALAESILPAVGGEFLGYHVNAVATAREAERLVVRARLGASPRGELDVAATRLRLLRELADPAVTTVEVEAQRPPRVRLRFVDELPGHGLRSYRVFGGAVRGAAEDAVTSGPSWIENRHWRVSAASDGRVTILRRADGVTIEDALRLVSEGDRGDEYNFDPVPDSPTVERPERVRVRVERAGTAAATLVLEGTHRVPESLTPDRARRAAKPVALPFSLRIRLSGALDRIDLEIALDNSARDHRLRLLARAPFGATRFRVESAFELADRPIAPASDSFGPERPAELPIGACPQRTFASLSDGARAFSVANRGNAEVEAVPEPDGTTSLAVTLLRAVGHLSRGDLRLRRGHAGPPFETPDAQVPGPHRAELALRLHAADDPDWISALHRFAYAPTVVAGAGGEAAPLRDGARLLIQDDPEVVVSAIEPRPDGSAIVRIYEAAGRARTASLTWNAPGDWTWEAVDLTDRPESRARLQTDGPRANVPLRACEIRNLRVSRH